MPEDQLDDASVVVLASEVDAALDAPAEWGRPASEPQRRPRWLLWVAVALLATAGLAPVAVWAIDG
ncbi:hypothetical protein D3C83_219980 [compost metagenome]